VLNEGQWKSRALHPSLRIGGSTPYDRTHAVGSFGPSETNTGSPDTPL
jgi:hypothetical protein